MIIMSDEIKITVWNEFVHEKKNKTVKKIYPNGIHEQIAQYLRKQPGFKVRTATLEDKDHGLTKDVINDTDVLIWWGHAAHDKVKDEIVDRVQNAVLNGMGLIVLHSGHFSKVFKRLMGTSCGLTWREDAERELLWVTDPYHPIAKGIDDGVFEVEYEEMYGEFFDIPKPDDIVFISNFEGGEVFRSGVTFHRGRGKIFYFRPGHESYPTYHNEMVLKVIANACKWCKFDGTREGAPTINVCTGMKFSMRPVEDRGYVMEEAIDHDAIHGKKE